MKEFFINNGFEKSFQKKLENAELRPRKDLWKGMESKIQTHNKKITSFHKIVNYSVVVLVISILIIPVIFLFNLSDKAHTTKAGLTAKPMNIIEENIVNNQKETLQTKEIASETKQANNNIQYRNNQSGNILATNPIQEVYQNNIQINQNFYTKDDTLNRVKKGRKLSSKKLQNLDYDKGKKVLTHQKELYLKVNLPKVATTEKGKYWVSLGASILYANPNVNTNYQAYMNDYMLAHGGRVDKTNNYFNALEEKNIQSFSYSIELRLGGKISDKYFLETGIFYTSIQSKRQSNAVFIDANQRRHSFTMGLMQNNITDPTLLNTVSQSPNYNSTGVSISQLNDNQVIEIEQNLSLINIPIHLGTNLFENNNIKFSISTGVSFDILNSASFENSTQISRNTQNSWSLGYQLQGNLEYKIGTNTTLMFSPSYRGVLYNPQKLNPYISINPSTLGLGLGIRYYLK